MLFLTIFYIASLSVCFVVIAHGTPIGTPVPFHVHSLSRDSRGAMNSKHAAKDLDASAPSVSKSSPVFSRKSSDGDHSILNKDDNLSPIRPADWIGNYGQHTHDIYYSLVQASMYILCFRALSVARTQGGVEFLRQCNWQRILRSTLRPWR